MMTPAHMYVFVVIAVFGISLGNAQCPAHCVSCGQTFATACDGCEFGYGLFGNVKTYSCAPCAVGCTNGCKNTKADKCDPCTTAAPCTVPCNSSYSYDAATATCVKCDVNCVSGCTQSGAGKCDSTCKAGYSVNASKVCVKCDVNCASGCSSSGADKCDTACKPGYSLSNNSCVLCDTNCTGGCVLNGANKCDAVCRSGYSVLSTTKVCVKCDVNCAIASGCSVNGENKCDTACNAGFSLWNNICVVCDSNCLDPNTGCNQTGAGKCDTTCKTGFEVNTTTNYCIPTINGGWSDWSPPCTDGFTGTRTRSCNNPTPTPKGLKCLTTDGTTRNTTETIPSNCPCDTNCISNCTINGANRCDTACVTGYSVSVTTKTCVKCDVNCISGCVSAGAGKCDTACKTEYTLFSNKTCIIVCDPHCASTCAANATCDGVCETNWLNLNKICVQCDPHCANKIGCSGKGANRCDVACDPGYSLYTGNYTCVVCDSKCLDQNSGCTTNGAGKCDSNCVAGYENSNFNCIKTVDGGWSSWSPNCTDGYKGTRTRNCTNPTPTPQGLKCLTSNNVTRALSETATNCPCDSNCAPSSGCQTQGAGRCDSKCNSGYGLDNTNYTCQKSVNGGWTTAFTEIPCTIKGQRTRTVTRTCTKPAPAYGGAWCTNSTGQLALVESNVTACPCDSHCVSSGCSTSGYLSCDSRCVSGWGIELGNHTCMKSVNGGWDATFTEIPCSSKSQRNQTLTRTCTNPSPAYGGAWCTDSSGQLALVERNVTACPCDPNCVPSGCSNTGYLSCDTTCVSGWGIENWNNTCMKSVDGVWGSWYNKTICTSLGQSTYTQERDCNNPAPAYGGNECLTTDGDTDLTESRDVLCPCDPHCQSSGCSSYGYLQCNGPCDSGYGIEPGNNTCLLTGDGVWSDWILTVNCTTIGQMTPQTQVRYCNNPPPVHGGLQCLNSTGGRALIEYNYTQCVWCDVHCTSGCVQQGNNKCDLACENRYGLNKNNYTCGFCPSPCNGSCNTKGPGTCDGPCIFGYGLTSTYLCGPCASKCISGCNDKGAGKCDTACATGYALSTTDYTCQPCDAQCTGGCTVPYKCSSTCAAGYVLHSTGNCLPCDNNCIKVVGSCNTQGKDRCDKTCINLFALNTTTYTCQACGVQCVNKCTTDGPGYCDVCTGSNCRSCTINYALKVVNNNKHSCYPCAPFCSSGCLKEGPGCCDTTCSSPLKWKAKDATGKCHTCSVR